MYIRFCEDVDSPSLARRFHVDSFEATAMDPPLLQESKGSYTGPPPPHRSSLTMSCSKPSWISRAFFGFFRVSHGVIIIPIAFFRRNAYASSFMGGALPETGSVTQRQLSAHHTHMTTSS